MHEPEYTDAHYPMEFSGAYLHIGNKKAWYSFPNGFGVELPGPPMGVYQWNPFMTLANADLVNDVECHAFTVTKANPEVAYFVNNKSKVQWVIGRGTYDFGISDWKWITDITPDEVNDPDYGIVVTDLVVNSKDENRIFVSLGGVNDPNNAGVNRVLGSTDGGANWADMSTGFTQLPVNCLAYQEGSDDIIYAGCDDGVYYWNKPTLCWVKMNYNMPNCVVERLVIDYCNGKLIAGTYGRGIWEGDLYIPNNIPGESHIISSDETWTGDKYIEGSVKVDAGKTLTISGTVNSPTTIHMPKWGNIRVEQGAKLIIDGATITNSCDAMWTGIYVDGDPISHQAAVGNGYYTQGYCEIKNGAIIENSENGVANWKSNLGGGIIIAENSTFRNNRRSVELLKYQNFHPVNLTPKADMSRFTNCVFEVNDNLSNQCVFSYFVTAWAIDGVRFQGCAFKNLQTNSTPREKAFYSIDASYNIEPLCLGNTYPCNSWQKCTFEGLDFGIDANGYSGIYDLQCDMSEFSGNQYGIKISALHAPILTRNEFEIGTITNQNLIAVGAPVLNNSNPYGIDMYYNDHFIVEENKFIGIPTVAKSNDALGLWVEYSLEDNEVYKNEYSELAYANVAFDENTYSNFGVDHGLKYKCNLQDDNWIDNMIHSEWNGINMTDGIHPIQGSAAVPAGNTFSHTSAFWESDIHNYADNVVNYYYHNAGNEVPLYYSSPMVVINSSNATNSCATNFTDGSYTGLHESARSSLKAAYATIEEEYLNLLYNYNALINGGNTNALLNAITTAWSEDAWVLRNQMISESPNLSETVLSSLASEDVLPTAMLLEVLTANPQSTGSSSFLEFLRSEIPHPLPEYMIDVIRASWVSTSYRKTLETQLSEKGATRSKLCNLIILNMLKDTVHSDYDSVGVWIDKLQTLPSRYYLVEYYVSKNNFTEASNVLSDIPQYFTLTESQQTELDAYTALLNFKHQLYDDTLEISQLDSIRILQLDSLVQLYPKTLAAVRASNALCFFYHMCQPFYSAGDTLSSLRPAIKTKQIAVEKSVVVYPNPAKDYMICKYNFMNKGEAQEFVVSDVAGKQIYKTTLKGSQGQHIWDTRNVGNGNYIYTVFTSNGEKYSGKVVVQK